MKDIQPATKPKPSPTPRGESKKTWEGPPSLVGRRLAERSWWLPWVIGAAVVTVGAVTAFQLFGDEEQPADWSQGQLPVSQHQVVYEVKGAGKSPELRYVIDGVNGTEIVAGADLPWHKEFTLRVGPGLGVVQVSAAANESAEPVSCSVSVDGNVVHQATAPAGGASVSCSSVIRPGKE